MCQVQRMKIIMVLIIFTAVFIVSHAFAQSKGSAKLGLKTTVLKEVKVKKPDGTTVLRGIPVDKTGPGDVLIYTITYVNMGKTAILDATIVDPIPAGTVYVLDSAKGKDAEITCSIDSGRSFQPPPVFMKFRKPGGPEERKPAPAEQYSHIRWIIKKPVLPGHSGRVSLKATVK